MSSTGSEKSSCPDRIAQATGLIRALAGVLDANVEGDAERIHSVVVVADAALSPWEVTRNIQSALLASLGLPIERAVIEVRRPEPVDSPASRGVAAGPAPAVPDGSSRNDRAAVADNGARMVRNGKAHGNGNVRGNGNGKVDGNGSGSVHGNGNGSGNADGNGNGTGSGRGGHLTGGAAVRRAGSATKPPANGSGPARMPGLVRAGYSVARLEVDTRRIGRVVCRAVVAGQNRISVGEADATDTPTGRLEAAARAVLAAAPVTGVDLEGIRALELAGRYYVVVAVRRWTGPASQYIAEVASVDGSLEVAAAHATLGAILR